MNQTLGQFALLGLLLSLATHACVLLGIDIAVRFPLVWVLDTGLFVLFVPMAVSLLTRSADGSDLVRSRGAIPRWVLVVGLCLFAYALLHSAHFAYTALQDDNPELAGGKYLQVDQGKVYRLVGLPTYNELKASELLAGSADWLLLYFVGFAWFNHRGKPDATA
jgi:hypothetical protein